MSERLPLLTLDGEADRPLFWHDAGPISRGRFAAGVAALAERLPARRYAVNLCDDRYAFCTALGAAALCGMTTLLPPSAAPAMIAALRQRYPDAVIFGDEHGHGEWPVAPRAPAETRRDLPGIPAGQTMALVFTSGSTGEPQSHLKTWRSLHQAGRLIARRLLPGLDPAQIVATVPMQHMYGLETAAALPLASGHGVFGGRPVYPDDVRAALSLVPSPRVLITAPVHLRALLNAGTRLPPLAGIVSATAPLSAELAARAEAAFGAPVYEIYGCTEAGSMATRRCIDGADWRLFDGITMTLDGEQPVIHAAHLPASVTLQDRLTPIPGGFRLLGRASDLLKVGGRRASLADLTRALLSIPGVVDGVVFQPQGAEGDGAVQRTAALVVSPSLGEREILAALAQRIDPIFMPRPLRKLASLPRNAVGKLPQSTLERLLTETGARA